MRVCVCARVRRWCFSARARARARSGAFEASFFRARTNCLFVETVAQRRALDVKRLERATHVITSVIK
jgi:hypothetical protein